MTIKVHDKGSLANYKKGCRCAPCQLVKKESNARDKAKRKSKEPPTDVHGTSSGYNTWQCRCQKCKAWYGVICARNSPEYVLWSTMKSTLIEVLAKEFNCHRDLVKEPLDKARKQYDKNKI